MKTKQRIFQSQTALVRTAIPGYRILRRVVELQRSTAAGVRYVGDGRPAESQSYPLAAE